MEQYAERSYIQASVIDLRPDSVIGLNSDIQVRGVFRLGARSVLGSNTKIRGNNVIIGDDFYCSGGITIGHGGWMNPTANLTIGDRCTMHNNDLNIAMPITVGNDVGLSPYVHIITHGYWLSVLDGFPAKFAPVTICDGAIVGWRSIVLPGVTIGAQAVVGAQSVVTKDLEPRGIYAGSPAKLIKYVDGPIQNKSEALLRIMDQYIPVAAYHGIYPLISCEYPIVHVNGCIFDVSTQTFKGTEDEATDDFRDYIRHWGIRFYSNRQFRSAWKW
jgi:acetyltransferase-like isoleucine patch superfamily enzyme